LKVLVKVYTSLMVVSIWRFGMKRPTKSENGVCPGSGAKRAGW
jgi:hypothetical protein